MSVVDWTGAAPSASRVSATATKRQKRDLDHHGDAVVLEGGDALETLDRRVLPAVKAEQGTCYFAFSGALGPVVPWQQVDPSPYSGLAGQWPERVPTIEFSDVALADHEVGEVDEFWVFTPLLSGGPHPKVHHLSRTGTNHIAGVVVRGGHSGLLNHLIKKLATGGPCDDGRRKSTLS